MDFLRGNAGGGLGLPPPPPPPPPLPPAGGASSGDLMGRLADFLPRMQAANEALVARLQHHDTCDDDDNVPSVQDTRSIHMGGSLIQRPAAAAAGVPAEVAAAAVIMDQSLHLVVDSEEEDDDDSSIDDDENDGRDIEDEKKPSKKRKLSRANQPPTVVLDLHLTSHDNPLFQMLQSNSNDDDESENDDTEETMSSPAERSNENDTEKAISNQHTAFLLSATAAPTSSKTKHQGPLITEVSDT